MFLYIRMLEEQYQCAAFVHVGPVPCYVDSS